MPTVFTTSRVFRERLVPPSGELVGYAALVQAYGVDAPVRRASCVVPTDETMCEPNAQPAAPPGGETRHRPNWAPFPPMVAEDRSSPFGPRMRRVPDSPELFELTRIAIELGDLRAV